MPQTAHLLGGAAAARSDSTDFFAKSKISGAMIGSAVDFFFMVDFTIVQNALGFASISENPGDLSDFPEYRSY